MIRLNKEKHNQGNFESLDNTRYLHYLQSTDLTNQVNTMEERKSLENSEISIKEIKIRKYEDESNSYQAVEFSMELPAKLTQYENFVRMIEPLIEKIEYYICNEGMPELDKRFHSSSAKHFVGSLLSSILKFFYDGKNLIFKFEVPRSQNLAISERAMKSILARIKEKSKTAVKSNLLKQDFVITYKEEFDPFTELGEEEILNELKKIIGSYELILEDCQRDWKVSFFHKNESNGVLLKPYNPKVSSVKKEKPGTPFNEEAEKSKSRAEWLFKDIKNAEKAPQKNQSSFHIPIKSPTDSTAIFGGEVEISECNDLEKQTNTNPQEKELQDMLISEYNNLANQKFLVRLRSFLVAKSPLKISINTAILLSVIYNQKINNIKEVKLADLPSFISISKLIPFPTTSALRTLNRWYFITKCIDRIMSVEIENCMPQSAYLPAIEDFDHEIYSKNVISANLCPRFLSFYGWQSIKITSPISDKLASYESQLVLLNKIFNLFTNCSEYANKENGNPFKQALQPSQTNQIEKMLKEIKNIVGFNEFAEHDYLNEAYSKIQKGTPIFPKNLSQSKISPTYKAIENRNGVYEEKSQSKAKNSEVIQESKGIEHSTQAIQAAINQSSDNLKKKSPGDKDIDRKEKISSLGEAKKLNQLANESTNKLNKSTPNKNERMDIEGDIFEGDMQIEYENNLFSNQDIFDSDFLKIIDASGKSMNEEIEENKNEVKNVSPSKKDSKAKNVEKEHEKSMKELMKKQTLAEAQNTLASLATTKLTPNLKKLRGDKIIEQIKKTEEWLESYKQNVERESKSVDQVKDLIQQIPDIPLRVTEMETLLEKQLQSSLWRVKFDALVKKYKKPKKKNANGSTAITLLELEAILREADALNIRTLSEEFQELRDKYEKIQSLKQTLKSCSNDLSVIRKIVKELNDSKISCEDLTEPFRERIELNERIILMLETNVHIDALEDFSRSIKDKIDMVDPILYKQLQHKNDEGKRLKSMISNIGLSKDTYEYEQISSIKSALHSISTFKIEIPNQQILTDVLSSFVWLLNLEKIIRNCKGNSSRANNSKDESYKMSFDILEKKFDPEEIVRYCTEWVLSAFNPRSVDENVVSQLRRLLKKANGFKVCDQRIKTLFNFLSEEISGNDEMIDEDPYRRDGTSYHAIEDEDILQEQSNSNQVVLSLKDWNSLYNQISSIKFDEYLRKNAEVNVKDSAATKVSMLDLKQKLVTLIKGYENLAQNSNLRDKVLSLKKFLGWLDWLLSAREWMTEGGENSEKNFKNLKEFHHQADKVEIPKSWPINKTIKEYFLLADSLITEYKQKFKNVSLDNNYRSKSPQKRSVSKQREANQPKPTIEEARNLRATLKKKLHFLNFEQDFGSLSEMIGQYSKWKASLESYVKNNSQRIVKASISPSSSLNDHLAIEVQLNQLKSDYSSLCLRDDEDEKTLTGLECQLKNFLLVKSNNKHSNIKEMKKIVKKAEENNIDQNAALNRVKTAIDNGKELQNTVKELRKLTERPDDPFTLQDLKKLQMNVKKGPVKSPEDVQFLEDLIQKAERLKNQAHQIVHSTKKKSLVEFKSVLDQLKHQLICIPEEEKSLEDAITSANKIIKFIKENSKLSPSATEKILKDYKNCPVSVPEAEKLADKFEKSKALCEKLKSKISELEKAKNDDYDQLKSVSNSLDDIHFDFEGNLIYMKAQVYSLRIKHLQKVAGAQDGSSVDKSSKQNDYDFEEELIQKTAILSSQTIKAMAREGHELKKSLLEQQKSAGVINQAIFWIDSICRKIDEKINEINAVSSLEFLDKMPKLLLGFIDLSQNFIERKAAISASNPVQQSQKKATPEKSTFLEASTKPSSTANKKGESIEKMISEDASAKSTTLTTPEVNPKSKSMQKQLKDFFNDKKTSKEFDEEVKDPLKDDLQQQKSPNQKTLKHFLIKTEMEKSEKQLRSNLELDKLSNPDISPKHGDSQLLQNKQKAGSFGGDLTLSVSQDTSVKINPKSKAIQRIRDILQNNDIDTSFDSVKSNNTAYRIVSSFPELDKSKILLEKFEVFLNEVLKQQNVFLMLVKKSFPAQQLSTLFSKSLYDLVALNRMLDKDKDKQEASKKSTTEAEANDGELATKKVKMNQNKARSNDPKETQNPITDLMKVDISPKKLPDNSKLRELMTDTANLDSKLQNETLPKGKIEVSPLNLSPFSQKSVSKSAQKDTTLIINENEEDKFSDHGIREEAGSFSREFGQPVGMDFEDLPHEHPQKNVQNKLSEPFPISDKMPYDPDDDSEDEFERQSKINEVSQIIKRNIFTKVPPGSVLKIFNGSLKEGDEEPTPPVGLYTCDPIQVIRSMPQILADRHGGLILEGKMTISKFEPYINKYANIFDNKKIELISGWVEALNPAHQAIFEKIANGFLAEQKVGVAKYLECTKIFFLHKNQFRHEWIERFKFKKRNLHGDSDSSLYFLFTFQPVKFTFDLSLLKRIEPEVVAPHRENRGDGWKNRKNYKGNERKPNAVKTGSSTPEIELCSDSLSQENTEHFRASLNDHRETNSKDSRSPMSNENVRRPLGYSPSARPLGYSPSARPLGYSPSAKPLGYSPSARPLGYSPSTNTVGGFGKKSPFRFSTDDKMEIEREKVPSVTKEKIPSVKKEQEAPMNNQNILNQPISNVISSSAPEKIIRDPRLRIGLRDFPKIENPNLQNNTSMAIENDGPNNRALSPNVQNNEVQSDNKIDLPEENKNTHPSGQHQETVKQTYTNSQKRTPDESFSPINVIEPRESGLDNKLDVSKVKQHQIIPYDPDNIQNEVPNQDLENNGNFPQFGTQDMVHEPAENQNNQGLIKLDSFNLFQQPQKQWGEQQQQQSTSFTNPNPEIDSFQQETEEQNYNQEPGFDMNAQEEPFGEDQQYYQGPSNDQQFNQYNQPKFGGNYQRANQNYRSPNKRNYDNRNNFQKPFYNNRSNNEGSNFQRNRYNPDQRNDNFVRRQDYRSSFNNQTPRRFSNNRFDAQQTPNRGFSNRVHQNFNPPRGYRNSFKRFPNQNTDFYSDQQLEDGSNLGYEQEGDSFDQNEMQNNTGINQIDAPSNHPSYKQESYSNHKPSMQSNSSNIQQGFLQRKGNAEDSIFGKARLNLLNASNSQGKNSDL